ncbi:Surfactin synthase subunit 1 [Paenibacillus plantiphilus]|uniref:Surfactin synthase subunit 1 n=1 Tax=Paenibacillus plantiphilus TaxID=2905650 RepID=A0ABM9BX86_9BACL|nr:non-ribosomal peptide synthetase [Paenibacillus plantiphilus]CAH1195716.1 Surfactin synthase subunit 1 [Paenibacillus plantiphilus]
MFGNQTAIEAYQLTHPQQRVWLVEKIYPDTSLHHLSAQSLKQGDIDINALEQAIGTFVRQNDCTRLRFIEREQVVQQYIHPYEPFQIDRIDFSIEGDPQAAYDSWLYKRLHKTFELEHEYLFNYAIIRTDKDHAGFLFIYHHLISDGWSICTMINRIWEMYASLAKGEEIASSGKESYLDYIASEQAYLSSSRFVKNQSFWNDKFKQLPEQFAVRSSLETAGKRANFLIDPQTSSAIRQLVKAQSCSLNTFFVMLSALYTRKITQRSDIVLGTPVLNRSGRKEKEMFGMFTSTMPFRTIVNDEAAILDWMETVNEDLMKCYFHQKYPYELLMKDIGLKQLGHDNLFDLSVNYYNTRMPTEVNGDAVETTELYSGNQLYSLQIVIKDWLADGSLNIEFDYKESLYSEAEITLMWNRMRILLQQILTNPGQRIGELEIVDGEEKAKLLSEWNDTSAGYPHEQSVQQLFEEQAARNPDRPALRWNDQSMSYGELNRKANALAHVLRDRGIVRDSMVAIMATHSQEVVIGILAVLKAGGAYVPIDPDYPEERIHYLLNDSGASVLLRNVDIDALRSYDGDAIDLRSHAIYEGDWGNPEPVSGPKDLAYIIYTSGSTGNPKGVMIEHQGLVNYIWWAKQMYIREDTEAFALYSSISFDLTVTSIFTPLINGNPIHIYSDDGSEFVLYRILRENATQIIKLTPSHLSLIKDLDLTGSSVRRFIVGGEDFKTSLAREIHASFGGQIDMYNEYGPTETVVGCMIHRFDIELDLGASVPIGRPADNVQLYVLDEGHQLLPAETVGELFISGDGVARGYLNRAALTAERFVDNPFLSGKRMYRTGDLVRYRADGIIDYFGRIDTQVKIRGYRIELGEIESHLTKRDAIREAVVIDRARPQGDVYLCAYYLADEDIDENELRRDMLQTMPGYMVPSYFIRIEEIPLTPNGKVNRAALPDIPLEAGTAGEIEINYENETERHVFETLREVLRIERIGRHHNFYQLGGDSIKAIQVAAKLSGLGLKVRVKDILSIPVLEELAAAVQTDNDRLQADQHAAAGEVLPTPITEWFFAQRNEMEQHWNQSILLALKQAIAPHELGNALEALVNHHDSLRLNLNRSSGRLYYNAEHLNAPVPVETVDLSAYEGEQWRQQLVERGEAIKSSLDIENGLPLHACLFTANYAGDQLLLLTAHHLMVDAVSWQIMLEDLALLLDGIKLGSTAKLPLKTHSYQVWADGLHNDPAKVLSGRAELDYWENTSKGFNWSMASQLADNPAGDNRMSSCRTVRATLSAEETASLLTGANASYRTEANELLVTALAMAVRSRTKQEEVYLELEGHGREELIDGIDINRTVGWFTSIFPFRLQLPHGDNGALIKSVKEQMRAIPNKGIGYGIHRYIHGSLPVMDTAAIRFNYLGRLDNGFDNHWFQLVNEDTGRDIGPDNRLNVLLDIVAAVVDGELTFSVTYSQEQFQQAAVTAFVNVLTASLQELIRHCLNETEPQFTPSDFETAGLSLSDLDMLLN